MTGVGEIEEDLSSGGVAPDAGDLARSAPFARPTLDRSVVQVQHRFAEDLLAHGADQGRETAREVAHPRAGRLSAEVDAVAQPLGALAVQRHAQAVLLMGNVQHQGVRGQAARDDRRRNWCISTGSRVSMRP